jgi:hypothetical protein
MRKRPQVRTTGRVALNELVGALKEIRTIGAR